MIVVLPGGKSAAVTHMGQSVSLRRQDGASRHQHRPLVAPPPDPAAWVAPAFWSGFMHYLVTQFLSAFLMPC